VSVTRPHHEGVRILDEGVVADARNDHEIGPAEEAVELLQEADGRRGIERPADHEHRRLPLRQ
jgi:hypothetical protein